ncbi:4193_t:CDS:2 [Acaulospora morrowiae]|uniref:4193_t:CDS:1 n=1 Tax=Acaulospora morrowiae TaxID=94023 RepID=A0A9N9EZP0_9GLOM|nr:4193_t:CDS:2 [Acaulospora morrowiae]
MAEYLKNVYKYLDANNLNPNKAIIDVLRLCAPEYITLGSDELTSDILRKTLVEVFIYEIIRLNGIPSIGNKFDAIFITAIIQKHGLNVREELNKWKNGQQFDLHLWITPTIKFVTISNLSKAVSIAKYVEDETYSYYAIQLDTYSRTHLQTGLDLIFNDTTAKKNNSNKDEDDIEEKEYGQDLNFDDVDYNLDYTKNIEKY